MACVPCAIEMEPKTLSPGQINHVREQAEAIQKMEPQIAADIFIQGSRNETMVVDQRLEPITKFDQAAASIGLDDGVIDQCCTKEDMKDKIEKSRQCLCTSILMEPPEEVVSLGEPLTAPF